jgi:threonine dehydrogenase-like Zn-dependent dehydrogenase
MPRQSSARAFWIVEPGRGELRSESLPEITPGDVLIRTLYSALSRGTEALVFRGEVPASESARMRAPFQAGEFPGPVKYGYISVGQVEQGPEALRGRAVFCMYPHQTHYVVPAAAVIPIPDTVPPARAVLAANLESVVNALWDAVPRVGDRISVVGAGTLGCLCAWLAAQVPGCKVELIDKNPAKASAARALGVPFKGPEQASLESDLVLHASGTAAGLSTALSLAGFEARIVELSWFGTRAVALPLGEAFHAKRLILQSSQVSAVASAQRGRWTPRRRMELVLRLLEDPRLDALISDESPFEELPAVLARLSTDPGDTLCHRIRYTA